MYWQDTKSTFSNDLIKLEESKFCGQYLLFNPCQDHTKVV